MPHDLAPWMARPTWLRAGVAGCSAATARASRHTPGSRTDETNSDWPRQRSTTTRRQRPTTTTDDNDRRQRPRQRPRRQTTATEDDGRYYDRGQDRLSRPTTHHAHTWFDSQSRPDCRIASPRSRSLAARIASDRERHERDASRPVRRACRRPRSWRRWRPAPTSISSQLADCLTRP